MIVLPSTAAVSEQDGFRAHSVMMTHTRKREGTHKEATGTGSGEQRVSFIRS